jgi:hypothetical protein
VIDAAGAIYVLGGDDRRGTGYLNDVWVSANGGADRTRDCSGRDWVVLRGYATTKVNGGTRGVMAGYKGVP